MEKSQKIFVSVGAIAVVGLAIVGGKLLLGDDNSSANTATTSASTTSSSATNTTSNASTSSSSTSTSSSGSSTSSYKDGQYSASQGYSVPKGATNTIAVTLTVSGGKITAVSVDNTYSDRESGQYISNFESMVDSSATGQSLSSYNPSRIAGASLTTDAFSQAIDTIRTKAAA